MFSLGTKGYYFIYILCFLVCTPSAVLPQQDLENLFNNGIINYRNGQYQQAMNQFTNLCEHTTRNPLITTGLLMAAKTAEHLNDYQLARSYARRLIQDYPESRYLSDAYYIMGCSYAQNGDDQDALIYLAYAVEHARTRKLLHISEEAGLQISRTRVDKNIVISIYKHHTWDRAKRILTLWLAASYLQAGDIDQADKVINSFLETRPSSRYEKLALDLRDSYKVEPSMVYIGVLQPLSGLFSQEADQFLKGLAMAIRENRTVRDKIKLVVKDSKGSPIQTVSAAKELIHIDQISLLLGELESGNSAITAGFAATTDIPLIIPIATDVGLADLGERIFQANQDLETRGRALADYAFNQLNCRTYAALAPADDYGHSITDAFLKHIDELGGRVISQQWYYPGTEDFKRQLQTIRKAAFRNAFRDSLHAMNIEITQQKIDSMFARQNRMSMEESDDEEGLIENDNIAAGAIEGFFLPLYKEDIPFVISQMALFNIEARPLGGTYWNNLDILRSQKRYVEGAVFTTGLTLLDTDPAYRKFVNNFRMATSQSPTQAALYGYNIMKLVISAVEQGYTTRNAIYNYLTSTRDFNVIGGAITFDKKHVNQAVNILEFREGNIRSVTE